jgi:limonene-1,2-epoxide hydrolase
MVAAPPPPPPAAIVRAWSKALNANDNQAAASLFAPAAHIVQPGVDFKLTPRLALLWHQALPCGGKIVKLVTRGERVTATFLLNERPFHRCDGPGMKAGAVFTVRKGKIVAWRQVLVKQPPPS